MITLNKFDDSVQVSGKKVLLRLDLNVPIVSGRVVDDFRIKKSIPTIKKILERGGKVRIIAHIENEKPTLEPLVESFSSLGEIRFMKDLIPSEDSIVLYENLRIYSGEKENDIEFSKKLASLGDIFVNEAFSVSHRPHASIVGVTKFLPSYAGDLFNEEVCRLAKALEPEHPFVFIVGGAKFDTKLSLVEKYLSLADTIFVGGALLHDVFRARGLNVGKSKISSGVDISSIINNSKLVIPSDVTVLSQGKAEVKSIKDVLGEEIIVDAGPSAVDILSPFIGKAKLIVWNGPLGLYEDGFDKETIRLGEAIARSSAESIIGGGDTIAALPEEVKEKMSFISTGGGAMLDFLANGTLPGIEPLRE